MNNRISEHIWPRPYPNEPTGHFAKRIAHRYKDIPEAFHLHRIHWQVMGHLTFSQLGLSHRKRMSAFTAFLRTLCHTQRLYYPKLFWALRSDIGTRHDLCPHFHFLIAALPKHIDLKTVCRLLRCLWRARGGGIAKVVPYTRKLGGAGYLGKRSDFNIGLVGGDCELMFSDAANSYLRRVVKRERGL